MQDCRGRDMAVNASYHRSTEQPHCLRLSQSTAEVECTLSKMENTRTLALYHISSEVFTLTSLVV